MAEATLWRYLCLLMLNALNSLNTQILNALLSVSFVITTYLNSFSRLTPVLILL